MMLLHCNNIKILHVPYYFKYEMIYIYIIYYQLVSLKMVH